MSGFVEGLSGPRGLLNRLKRRHVLVGLCAVVGAAPVASSAVAQVTVPQPGSTLRSAILEGLRPVVQRELGGKVEFAVSQMRVLEGWAYVSARPQRPGGVAMDWSATKFRKAWVNDTMSDLVLGLLKHEGDGWRVVECAIGPTDVAWEDWIKPHGVPRRLFSDQ